MCLFRSFIRFFFFKQKTAYDMRISDWSSDVCSSDLLTTIQEYTGVGVTSSNGDRRAISAQIDSGQIVVHLIGSITSLVSISKPQLPIAVVSPAFYLTTIQQCTCVAGPSSNADRREIGRAHV